MNGLAGQTPDDAEDEEDRPIDSVVNLPADVNADPWALEGGEEEAEQLKRTPVEFSSEEERSASTIPDAPDSIPDACIPSSIPEELRARPQWVDWQYEVRDGEPKPTKVPYNARTRGRASSTDPSTWSAFEQAVAAVSEYNGVGFVLTPDDPYVGIDLDHCRNSVTGVIEPWAQAILDELNSYTEITPSGEGLRIFVRGSLPSGGRKRGNIEMYDRARYLTVTGQHLAGTPTTIEERSAELAALHGRIFASSHPTPTDRQRPAIPVDLDDAALLDRARRAANGEKFAQLWAGDVGDTSHSEADLTLCRLLAFWTGRDPQRVDRLFRQSGLYRSKWDEKHSADGRTYGQMTIDKAIAGCTEVYAPNSGDSGNFGDRGEWQPPVPFHHFDRPEFPTDALPGWLKEYVEATATETQTPRDLPAMVSLSAMAAALAKKFQVEAKPGYVEPVNIFTATSMEPGNRKSQVFSTVTAPLQEFEEEEARRLAPEIRATETSQKIAQTRLQKAQDAAAKAEPHERQAREAEAQRCAQELASITIPMPSRLVVDDITPERLASLLHDHGGRIALMSPEGDFFDMLAGRYSTNSAPNFGVFLRGHAGDDIRVDRVGRPPEYVKRPALTVGVTIQPDVLRGLIKNPGFRGRGLLGRFLYSLPNSLLGQRRANPPCMPSEIRRAYHTQMEKLLRLPASTDANGDPAPYTLRLTFDAETLMYDFANWIEPQLAEFGELGHMTDWAAKLVGAVARIAALLHVATYADDSAPWRHPLNVDTVNRAIRIGRYLIAHARAAFAEMGADPAVEDARYLLAWIKKKVPEGQKVTLRDLYQGTKGRFKKAEALNPGLTVLRDHGFIREQPEASRSGPGRKPSPTFEVNPAVWAPEPQNSHNSQNDGCEGSTEVYKF